jgi:hypothetical protein
MLRIKSSRILFLFLMKMGCISCGYQPIHLPVDLKISIKLLMVDCLFCGANAKITIFRILKKYFS